MPVGILFRVTRPSGTHSPLGVLSHELIPKMISLLHQLKLRTLISAVVMITALAISTALTLTVRSTLSIDQAERAIGREITGLNIAATLLSSRYPDVQISWSDDRHINRITVTKLPDFGDQTLIDDISRATGDPASIFKIDETRGDFVRISTSVRRADGSRVIGTYLGQEDGRTKALLQGHFYNGEVDVLGVPFFAVYAPIFNQYD